MDKIFYNGKIYSIDENNSVYTAIGIDKGKIAFLGGDSEAMAIAADGKTEKTDLKGRTVLPGFVDSHLHMLNYAFIKQSYGMFSARSVKEIIETGRKMSDEIKDEGKWLYGRGWNESRFTDEKRPLTRFDLDEISADRPILFIRVCGHKAAVNTKALRLIMGLEQTKDYTGQIDEENGILTEAAVKLCYDVMREPSVDEIKEMILLAQRELNEAGITGVETDNFLSLPGRNGERIMEAYRQLEKEGRLTLRVREQASFTSFDHMKAFIDKGYRTGQGGEYYTIGPVKLYEDGSLGARTALMHKPYRGTDDHGVAVHDEAETEKLVDYAYKNGMQIIIHAIGDKASDMVCGAYEKAIKKYGERDSRLAINHLQIISRELLDRMKKYDILAYIQPVFAATDRDVTETLLDSETVSRSYMWNTMMKKGIRCCGSSDSPVEAFSVLGNIQTAVTREAADEDFGGWRPEESLSVLDAVKLFTINNAYGSFTEDRRGSLEIGKDADMTVLDGDIFRTDPHEIHKIKPSMTIVAGKEVYRADAERGIQAAEPDR